MRNQVKARLEITGLTPLVINNIEMADSEGYEYARLAKEITSKPAKSRTPEMSEQLHALEWRGSFYESDSIVFPGRNFIRAITDAARGFKQGASIDRGAVAVTEVEIPVLHDGPALSYDKATGLSYGTVDYKAMYQNKRYRFRSVVNKNPASGKKAMVPTMRPILPVWAMSVTVVVFTEILGWDKFVQIIEAAGAQGIGNGRKLGFGKFDVVVQQL